MAIAKSGLPSKAAEFLFGEVGMSHRFVVVIDKSKYDLGTWSRVAGLGVSWKACTYRPGESNDELAFPGNISYPNIKLSRAACADSGIVKSWLEDTSRQHKLLSGAVLMVDYMNLPVVTWELKQFFPIGWSITDFDSSGTKPAVETLELAHTGFLDNEVRAR